MTIVTVAARCGILPAFGQGQGVDAGAVALGLLLVARLAIGRFGRDVIVWVVSGEIRVAARAGVGLVDGGLELCHIDKQGNYVACGVGLGEGLVPVTLQAGAVLDRFGGSSSGWRPIEGKKGCGQ